MLRRETRLFTILLCWLLAGSVLLTGAPSAGAEGDPQTDVGTDAAPPPPSLADIVYQAGSLNQRLITLNEKIAGMGGLKSLDEPLTQAKARVDDIEHRLKAINTEDLQSYQQLASLRGELREVNDLVSRSSVSLTEKIQRVEDWRRQWVAEKTKWNQWHAGMGDDLALASVSEAFSRAEAEIKEALGRVSEKLEPMLGVQQKAGDIASRIDTLKARIDDVMAKQRGGALRGGTPMIFSISYLQQLIDLAHEPAKIVKPQVLPDAGFFSDKGWVILLQAVVFVLLLTLLRHSRAQLIVQTGRRFLGKRAVSVSLLVPIFSLSFLYGVLPPLWRMLILSLAGVATARLLTTFVATGWIKRSIYVLAAVMIMFQLLLILGIPLALMRLFILVWAGAGVVYFGWRSRRRALADAPGWQVWLLRLVVLVFLVILIADTIGFGGFAVQLMDSALRTAMLPLMAWAMIRLCRVGLEMGVEAFPMGSVAFLRSNANEILARLVFIVKAVIIFFVATNLLVAWKLYAIPSDAISDIFAFGFTLGGHTITVGLVLTAGIILYATFVISWTLQGLLMNNVLNRGQMDIGVSLSIVRLMHYALVLIGFLIALSAMGFELQNITIIGGALGVGLGFGLQNIVNNFVSGLILLFERPIKVGDVIQLNDGQQGRVTNLGLRATTVQTFDRAEIVVPNGDLISSQVTNWTLGDRSMRLTVPVGVAYGSDVETVMRVLMEVASSSDRVLTEPQPMVLFLNFGDSSLDFQLRVWIPDFNDRRIIQSALIREIDRRFREEGVEIPFPQQDLHLRSVDAEAAGRLTGASNTTPAGGDAQNSAAGAAPATAEGHDS
jgi:potassium-dependent mechanosensitive channel